jgi:putative membrane protein
MINRYTDHSANERTYLAWIRTAVAVMAFGFLIEKFDLFVSYIGKAIGDEEHFQASLSAEIVGLGLFLVGIIITITATIRFFMFKKAIESNESMSYDVKKTKIFLSILMVALALFLFFYMASQVFG